MSERDTTATEDTTGRDTGRDTTGDELVSVAEAAVRLGITPSGVRKRLERHTLEGRRDGGTWRVRLSGVTSGATRDTTRDRTGHDTRHDTTPPVASRLTESTLYRELYEREHERAVHLEDELRAVRDRLETEVRAGAELQYWRGQADAWRAQATELRDKLEDAETLELEATSGLRPVDEAAPEPVRPSIFATLFRRR